MFAASKSKKLSDGRFCKLSRRALALGATALLSAAAIGSSGTWVVDNGELKVGDTASFLASPGTSLIVFTNTASLAFVGTKPCPLPDVSFFVPSGERRSISGGSYESRPTVANLSKTGEGTLFVESPFAVTGRTEIKSGTLKLANIAPLDTSVEGVVEPQPVFSNLVFASGTTLDLSDNAGFLVNNMVGSPKVVNSGVFGVAGKWTLTSVNDVLTVSGEKAKFGDMPVQGLLAFVDGSEFDFKDAATEAAFAKAVAAAGAAGIVVAKSNGVMGNGNQADDMMLSLPLPTSATCQRWSMYIGDDGATVRLALDPEDTSSASETAVVRPENTDEILVNPDMGLVLFHYSNRQWAYGQLQERGDTLDWFPGVSAAYFRLPWCLLEPKEGEYRWDLIDSYAAPWIAAGKQIGLRVTCCESRYPFATPEWVKDAGAKGWFFKMKMSPIFGKEVPGGEVDLWEPDYGDPVFLAKLEKFLKVMARRYDGNPNVAFIDVGTIGMWGEGHTRAYKREMEAQGRDIREAFPEHYRMHKRVFPNSTVLCIDDQAGGVNKDPDPPLMKLARELGFGFRDDSILVNEKHSWFHDNWADLFAPKAPVFVEHEHYNLSSERGAWSDEKLVESVEAYRASWLSIHGWPKECYDKAKDAYARAARRIGYRFELREVSYPKSIKIGEQFAVKSQWVNVGVARRYKGATLAWTLLDSKGRVAWVSSDESFDFKDAEPKLGGTEHPVSLSSRCTVGYVGEIPQINDGVWVYTVKEKVGNFANDTRVPTIEPGEYTLCASLGDPDGTPRIALPLKGGEGRRYPVGKITLK